MPIEFLCPKCSKQLRVPDTAAGKQAKCPSCDNVCSIPAATATAAANVAASYAPPGESPPNPFSKPQPGQPQSAQSEHLKETNYFPNQQSATDGTAGANPYAAPSAAAGAANVNVGSRFEMATRLSRFGGRLIDMLLMFLGGAVVAGILAVLGGTIADDDAGAAIGGYIGLYVGMFLVAVVNWFLIVRSGQTIGKKILGTKIVMESTGQIPDFVQGVLLRNIVFAILGAVPLLGLIVSLTNACWIFGENRQCLHDLMAKTRVIKA